MKPSSRVGVTVGAVVVLLAVSMGRAQEPKKLFPVNPWVVGEQHRFEYSEAAPAEFDAVTIDVKRVDKNGGELEWRQRRPRWKPLGADTSQRSADLISKLRKRLDADVKEVVYRLRLDANGKITGVFNLNEIAEQEAKRLVAVRDSLVETIRDENVRASTASLLELLLPPPDHGKVEKQALERCSFLTVACGLLLELDFKDESETTLVDADLDYEMPAKLTRVLKSLEETRFEASIEIASVVEPAKAKATIAEWARVRLKHSEKAAAELEKASLPYERSERITCRLNTKSGLPILVVQETKGRRGTAKTNEKRTLRWRSTIPAK